MTNILTTNWRVSEDAIASSVGGETVILHIGTGKYYGLDRIGTLLWEGLTAGERPRDVCERIVNDYEVELAVLEADMTEFLEELKTNQLVEQAEGFAP